MWKFIRYKENKVIEHEAQQQISIYSMLKIAVENNLLHIYFFRNIISNLFNVFIFGKLNAPI